ncbi:palmitoyltransferase ZDHHC7-like isoform 2-T2 [Pluvialis apricaria]
MAAAAAGRCGRDPCGAVCPLLTYLGVGYADYAVLAHVLPQPALRGSPWCPFHAAAFNLIVLLLLACHTRAVLADPGVVPLPGTAIDFSDLRSGAWRTPELNQEDWTVCDRCEAYRPPRAHHCRVCHRCVRRMDHHCPWINNCVGELNQKYFIQFLFYTGLASLYAAGLVLAAWLGPAGRSPAGMMAGGDISNNHVQTAHCIVLLLESLLFGAFVAVVFYDQASCSAGSSPGAVAPARAPRTAPCPAAASELLAPDTREDAGNVPVVDSRLDAELRWSFTTSMPGTVSPLTPPPRG